MERLAVKLFNSKFLSGTIPAFVQRWCNRAEMGLYYYIRRSRRVKR